MKKLIIILFVLLTPTLVSASLELEKLNPCNISYSGESCAIDLNLTSSESTTVDAILTVQYSGQCGDSFDGIGIVSSLNNKILDTELDVSAGLNKLQLRINTAPGLCPGNYLFQLQLASQYYETVSTGGGFSNYAIKTIVPKETTPKEIEKDIASIFEEDFVNIEPIGIKPTDIESTDIKPITIELITTSTTSITNVLETNTKTENISDNHKLFWLIIILVLIFLIIIIFYYKVSKKK